MIDPRAIPTRERGAEGSRLGAEFVLLDADAKTIRGLNATGARVWELVDGERTLEQIAARIAQEFMVPLERALADVQAFVEALAARGVLIVRATADVSPSEVR